MRGSLPLTDLWKSTLLSSPTTTCRRDGDLRGLSRAGTSDSPEHKLEHPGRAERAPLVCVMRQRIPSMRAQGCGQTCLSANSGRGAPLVQTCEARHERRTWLASPRSTSKRPPLRYAAVHACRTRECVKEATVSLDPLARHTRLHAHTRASACAHEQLHARAPVVEHTVYAHPRF